MARAVREEDGWNAFVATAAWWVGEHANSLCGEYAGEMTSLDGGFEVVTVWWEQLGGGWLQFGGAGGGRGD